MLWRGSESESVVLGPPPPALRQLRVTGAQLQLLLGAGGREHARGQLRNYFYDYLIKLTTNPREV